MSSNLADRLAAGTRLTEADARALASTTDLLALGVAADEARRKRHGDRVTFVRVAEFSMSRANFRLKPEATVGAPEATVGASEATVGGPEATVGALEVTAGAASAPTAAGEFRVTGVPEDLDQACVFVRSVAAIAKAVPVSGFSLADLELLCGAADGALAAGLTRLRDAGLELVAEAPIDRLQDPLRALRAVAAAGLRVARVTVHQHSGVDGVSILSQVARLQEEVGGMRAFAPLARAWSPAVPTTGYDDVKQVALARLLVDNVESVQVDWALHGPKLAQVALTFGADDVDAVSPFDTRDLGLRRAPLEEIRRNIRAASFVPVERNGRFETVTR